MFDLGQNFAGFARLKVTGEKGTKVRLRFAEMLNPDGTIYTENLRGAKCTDTYICKGEGEEVWQPLFTFPRLPLCRSNRLSGQTAGGCDHRHRDQLARSDGRRISSCSANPMVKPAL